jgi:phosphatidylglycerol lysyltransferase
MGITLFVMIAIIIATFILLSYIKRATIDLNESLDDVQSFLEINGGTHLSHLTFLNDKEVFRTANNKALVVFQKVGKRAIVLGDPIGKDEFIEQTILEFQNYCHENKMIPIFYQVSERYMNFYEKCGYEFFKQGQEARMDLHQYTLAGKKGAKLRTRRNKFERNGYQFHVSIPSHSQELINEVEFISNSWLDGRKEKGYSVSFYSEDYLSRFPIAYLTNPEGNIIAFASLACDKQKQNRTITVDLMRHSKDCPHGTMDMLFTSIFQWCKENGYDWCSLGMSPLANVGMDKQAPIYEKLARFVFQYGNVFYQFKGLHEYKNKFGPNWEARYLAYKDSFLPVLLLQLVFLIHKDNVKTEQPKPLWQKAIRRARAS